MLKKMAIEALIATLKVMLWVSIQAVWLVKVQVVTHQHFLFWCLFTVATAMLSYVLLNMALTKIFTLICRMVVALPWLLWTKTLHLCGVLDDLFDRLLAGKPHFYVGPPVTSPWFLFQKPGVMTWQDVIRYKVFPAVRMAYSTLSGYSLIEKLVVAYVCYLTLCRVIPVMKSVVMVVLRKVRRLVSMRIQAKQLAKTVINAYTETDGAIKQAFSIEKMVQGSVLVEAPQPTIQCDVEIRAPGIPFTYSGQAFRIDNYLYTAQHVMDNATGVRFRTAKGMVEIFDLERIETLDGDIGRVLITPQEIGALQVASGKFSEVPRGKVLASCYAKGQRSIGFVRPYDAFGYVEYNGSTVGGHSGAPYLLNKQVIGMHLGGHAVNIGYDGQYLRMIHKRTQESSEDYFEGVIQRALKKGKRMNVRSSANPDEVEIHYNGMYHTVDKDTYHQWVSQAQEGEEHWMYETAINWDTKIQRDEQKPEPEVDDLPKNDESPVATVGATGSKSVTAKLDVPSQSRPISEGILGSRVPLERTLDLPSSTLAQLKDLLDCMSNESMLKDQASVLSNLAMRETKQYIRQFLDMVNGVSQLGRRDSPTGLTSSSGGD